MSCAEADSLLKEQPNNHGSYLVHADSQGVYCLSIRDKDTFVHYQIQSSNGLVYIVKEEAFRTLYDLIHHYMQHVGSLCTTLREPCSTLHGPLHNHIVQNVDEGDVSSKGSFATVRVLEVYGERYAGKQLNATYFPINVASDLREMLLKFADICQLLKTLQHPNIELFLGAYVSSKSESPVPYLVMELLDSTLSDYLEKHGVPNAPTYYSILSDVALGLCYLHQQTPPIIHRGLSANSILLSSSLQAKISDLSVAKVLNLTPAAQTQVNVIQCYMPPEALADSPQYTTSTDCFSFGILMLHTLSGELPVLRVHSIEEKEVNSQATESSKRKPYLEKVGIHHPLMNTIQSCLHNEPKARPDMPMTLNVITHIQSSHTTCTTSIVCASHEADTSGELSLKIGEEVAILDKGEGDTAKAKCLKTLEVGYQLPLFVGLVDYSSDCDDSLDFKKGDLIHIINTDEQERWFGLHKATWRKGYFPKIHVQEKLERMRWYLGKISHAEAANLLKQQGNSYGSYLVHDECQNVRCLAIRDQESVKHYQIHTYNETSFIVNEVMFKTLQDLVHHYSVHAGALCTTLKCACNAELGPLQPYLLHHVKEVQISGDKTQFAVSKFEISGRKRIGKQLHASEISLSTAEEYHEMLLQFADVCRLLKHVQHPNIVDFVGVYIPSETTSSIPYLVTEFLDTTLSVYVEKHGIPDAPTYYSILSNVALGLCYLHQQLPAIVHGGLSASSVLLSSSLQAKISDLGITKVLSLTQAQANQTLTPQMQCYKPAEVSLQYTTSLDCFSFGILMLHVLSGQWPIPATIKCKDSGSNLSMTEVHQRDKYFKAIEFNHPLTNLIRKCMHSNSNCRPDMSTIAQTIDQVKEKQLSGRDSSATSRLVDKFSTLGRRHKKWNISSPEHEPQHRAMFSPVHGFATLKLVTPSHSQSRVFVGVYDYDAHTEDDISFRKREQMLVLKRDEDGWWFARSKKTGKEGYVPSNYITPWSGLESEKWFFPHVNCEQAKRVLMMPPNACGSFLVGKSEIYPTEYFLSVRDEERVQHLRIRQMDDARFYITRHALFFSVPEVVNNYIRKQHTRQLQPCAPLQKPSTPGLSKQTNKDWEIERNDIQLMRKMGEGNFGEVWEGTWKNTVSVAIKILTPGTISSQQFLKEVDIVKKLRHSNLIQLYAICTKEEPIFIVTELMKPGSLLTFLQTNKQSLNRHQLIDMSVQVARGMAHSEIHGYIHKNLAARNVLIGQNFTCKVSDLGLTGIIDYEMYKPCAEKRLSIKWTAPEAAVHNRFSIKSDVWSFGIVLYEIITRGHVPYPDLTDSEVLEKLQCGYRMSCPHNCPMLLHGFMLHCWKTDPEDRYTFESLKSHLENYLATAGLMY